MTNRRLVKWVVLVAVIFAVYGLGGIGIGWRLGEKSKEYTLFKDVFGVLIGLASAWLAYGFNRRNNYVQALRGYFDSLLPVIQNAIQYTHLEHPTQDEFAKVFSALGAKIDGLRSVFKNVGDAPTGPQGQRIGYYPYENLKTITEIIIRLGFGRQIPKEERDNARNAIVTYWAIMHQHLLREFDRDEPVEPLTINSDKYQELRKSVGPTGPKISVTGGE
jgi:hypothetical protein